ncbi:MAG: PQQ-dependent sugar dehydrogenase [Acidobacteriaceae bacterium]
MSRTTSASRVLGPLLFPALLLTVLPALAQSTHVVTGQAAFTDFSKEKPGTMRKITVADLPVPYATQSVDNGPDLVARPAGAMPEAPAGFKVELYSSDVKSPRLIRTAPNGDLFVVESEPDRSGDSGTVKVFRGVDASGKAKQVETFATGLKQPFGLAFYPLGPNPKWIYIGNTDSVVKFPYKNGDLKATGPSQVVVPDLPGGGRLRGGGHWTRDVVFSKDGTRMFVSVGSHSNVDDPDTTPAEFHRADVLEFTPEGKFVKVYASGIRNCVGEAINPITGQLWCSTNERDGLGDNLVPDYITHVQEGGFYGWPWFYMGNHQDPRHKGKHPELANKVIVPDVLLQPHFASLEMTFDESSKFPASYKGWAFAAEHGSWNKSKRAGYEVIAVPVENGKATGAYQDFLTGFVKPDGNVWGRPVGVTFGKDGALYVTDDGSSSIWRVSYTGAKQVAGK